MAKELKNEISGLLARYIAEGTITEAKARALLSLPLIETPPLGNGAENEWATFLDSAKANVARDGVLLTRDDFVLLEASYLFRGFGFYVLRLKPADKEDEYGPLDIDFDIFYDDFNGKSVAVKISGELKIPQIRDADPEIKNLTITWKGKRLNLEAQDYKNTKIAGQRIIHSLSILYYFSMFQDEMDRYAVHVQRKVPKKLLVGANKVEKRLEHVIANSPKIIYLNALPIERKGSENEDGTGIQRQLHQRRGYRITLRNPRYAKHPKYLIEKGVKVKAAWIGSKVGEYNGNVYKVILPKDLGDVE